MTLETREFYIERLVVDYAKQLKMDVVKLGQNGYPDRMFITKTGNIFFIEFKSLDGKLSKQQEHVIKTMKDKHVDVYVIDNIKDGVDVCIKHDKIQHLTLKRQLND